MSKFLVNNPAWLQMASCIKSFSPLIITPAMDDIIFPIGAEGQVKIVSTKNGEQKTEIYDNLPVLDYPPFGTNVSIECDEGTDVIIEGNIIGGFINIANTFDQKALIISCRNIDGIKYLQLVSPFAPPFEKTVNGISASMPKFPDSCTNIILNTDVYLFEENDWTDKDFDFSYLKHLIAILQYGTIQLGNVKFKGEQIRNIDISCKKLDLSECNNVNSIGSYSNSGISSALNIGDIIGLDKQTNLHTFSFESYGGFSLEIPISVRRLVYGETPNIDGFDFSEYSNLEYLQISNSNISTLDLRNLVNLTKLTIINAPEINNIYAIAINSDVANAIASKINGSSFTNGVVHLRNGDEFNSVIANEATAKGWTIEYV